MSQLSSAIDLVDEEAQEDVTNSLAFAANLTTVLVAAADEVAAEEATTPIFESMQDGLPGAASVLDNCGIDIAG